jgi:hypothetical protein
VDIRTAYRNSCVLFDISLEEAEHVIAKRDELANAVEALQDKLNNPDRGKRKPGRRPKITAEPIIAEIERFRAEHHGEFLSRRRLPKNWRFTSILCKTVAGGPAKRGLQSFPNTGASKINHIYPPPQ